MRPPYDCSYPLTAGELRRAIASVDDDTPVYVVLDMSDDNYNPATGTYDLAHPIERVDVETLCDVESFYGDDEEETNLVLYLAEDFYCQFQNQK